MDVINTGWTRFPPFAKGAKANAISNGVTSEVPRTRDKLGLRGLVMPSCFAHSIPFSGPTIFARDTDITLHEVTKASLRVNHLK